MTKTWYIWGSDRLKVGATLKMVIHIMIRLFPFIRQQWVVSIAF